MTPQLREALREVAASHPDGSLVPVLREQLLELLDGRPVSKEAESGMDLTCQQLAEALGRDGSTVRAWVARGDFAGAYRLNGREWRIPRGSLHEWQEAQRRGHATPGPPAASGRRRLRLSSWRSAAGKAPEGEKSVRKSVQDGDA